DRHLEETRSLRRPPSPFTGDDAIEVATLLRENRLDHTMFPDRLRQFLELRVVHLHARLLLVRRQQINVHIKHAAADWLRRVGNQRAQSLTEGWTSLDHVCFLESITLRVPRGAKAFLSRARRTQRPHGILCRTEWPACRDSAPRRVERCAG